MTVKETAEGDAYYRELVVVQYLNLSDNERCALGIETQQPIPLRWTAPEVLATRKYTSSSDVYAFGVLIHELYSPTEMPFGELDDVSVIKVLLGKARIHSTDGSSPTLPAPHSCPAAMAQVMEACVQANPLCRPSFPQLFDMLEFDTGNSAVAQTFSLLNQETRL